ncbi:MAG: glutamate formimidoyltransferase [Candidatus Riflebacteria bacterium]|nr:glutamate formimidoyltransferase [Candidatus Riflebacteria bacterium]
MSRLVECVPNFSEGRDKGKIEEICKALASVPGATLLDHEGDPDHNRSVITVVGTPEAVAESAFQGAKAAQRLIDLNQHRGAHPRMGAVDVIPFIPIRDVGMDTCIALARQVGERIGNQLEIPVYLYERAATRPDREDLAAVRQGEFEGLRVAIGSDPARSPDFGPARIHPTAGAVAVGARFFLVAFNVNLATDRIEVAQRIAKVLRFRTGGFRHVKALGFSLRERGIVQVSMNLINYRESAVHRIFAMVEEEARRYGVNILESEIVGLVPNEAMVMTAEHALRLYDAWTPRQILENRLLEVQSESQNTLGPLLDRFAAPTTAPGGGSASAAMAALGTALTAMVCGLTHGKKAYTAHWERVLAARETAERMRRELTELVEKDARAFEGLMAANRLPKEPETRAAVRDEAIRKATREAVAVPLRVMELGCEALELAAGLADCTLASAVTDLGVGALAAEAGVIGAGYNVQANLVPGTEPALIAEAEPKATTLLARARTHAEAIRNHVAARLAKMRET